MHMAELVYPVLNGTVTNTYSQGETWKNPSSTVHVVQGTAGAFIDEEYIEPQPAWSASRHQRYGYGRLTVYNSTTFSYQYIKIDDGGVGFEFTLQK